MIPLITEVVIKPAIKKNYKSYQRINYLSYQQNIYLLLVLIILLVAGELRLIMIIANVLFIHMCRSKQHSQLIFWTELYL